MTFAFLWSMFAAAGTYLLFSAGRPGKPARSRELMDRLRQAGVVRAQIGGLVVAIVTVGVVGGLLTVVLFGVGPAAMVVAVAAGSAPAIGIRTRRRERQEVAMQAWPRILEEVRLQVANLGRSIPHALFAVGRDVPPDLRTAFQEAEREWLTSTDLERAFAVLREQLADPTADTACETLLIAHEVGGTDIDGRLRALIEDRTVELQGRKDARAKQAGVRFARSFVLAVPVGMALIGSLIGDGRAAYASPGGQSAILLALGMLAGCWLWAGRLLRLPEQERIFRAGGYR